MEQHAQKKHEIRQKDRTWFSHFFYPTRRQVGAIVWCSTAHVSLL